MRVIVKRLGALALIGTFVFAAVSQVPGRPPVTFRAPIMTGPVAQPVHPITVRPVTPVPARPVSPTATFRPQATSGSTSDSATNRPFPPTVPKPFPGGVAPNGSNAPPFIKSSTSTGSTTRASDTTTTTLYTTTITPVPTST